MSNQMISGLMVPADLLPTIYHALQREGEREIYRCLCQLERDQDECRSDGRCPACGDDPEAGMADRLALRLLQKEVETLRADIAVERNRTAALADTVVRLTDELSVWTDACPRCHGDGTVMINRSRDNDPQCAEDVRCSGCGGSGYVAVIA